MVERTRLGTYGTPRRSALREALIAGLIGAGVVALWFLVVDIMKDQIWFTPAALGSAVFLGARGVDEVQIAPAMILGYTLLHIVLFFGLAWIAVQLMRSAEHEPRAWLGIVLLFVVTEVFVLGLLAIVANWLLEALSMWTVVIANLLAAVGMGLFLWKAHPAMREDLRLNPEEAQ